MRSATLWARLLGLSKVVVEGVELDEDDEAIVVSVRPGRQRSAGAAGAGGAPRSMTGGTVAGVERDEGECLALGGRARRHRSQIPQLCPGQFPRPLQGAAAEAVADVLWPEVDPARGREPFWTALGNLRSRLREATGGTEKLIERHGDLYRVEAGVFDVDLWRCQTALAEARASPGSTRSRKRKRCHSPRTSASNPYCGPPWLG